MAIVILAGIWMLHRWQDKFAIYYEVFSGCAFVAICAPFVFLGNGFIIATAWCWGLFVFAPVLACACAFFAWKKFRPTAVFYAVIALVLPVVGIEAFFIEPHKITIRHETLVSPKIVKPVRLVVIADIQTDDVGLYEEEVLQKAMQEKPDMIILPGDYIQAWSKDFQKQSDLLNALFKKVKLSAPLGVYVTPGDMEWLPTAAWTGTFKNVPSTIFTETKTIETPDFTITGLTLHDSRYRVKTPQSDKFHIVIGHAPDFSIDKPNGDLYIAGHTHGGQVQIPFVGPLVYFSGVPRKQAAGCFTKVNENPDKYLMISRGIGMERLDAPRLRFLCLPEIVVIDLKPAEK